MFTDDGTSLGMWLSAALMVAGVGFIVACIETARGTKR